MNFDFIKTLDLEHGGNLIIMVGPPGSGKTTTAEQIQANFNNFTIISPDKIRKEITEDSGNRIQNDIVFAQVYSQLISKLENGYNVIYDATNCRSTYRYKIIDVCKPYTYKIICLVSTTPISECIKHNDMRNGEVPEEVIENMYFTLKKHPPIIFEGYDLIARF